MDDYHITKDGDKWKLTKEGNQCASRTADTKQEIIKQMHGYMPLLENCGFEQQRLVQPSH